MRVRNIVWIICIVAVVGAAGLVSAEGEHTYISDAKCKMCHKVQHASWLETSHAKATENAKASTEREFSEDCLKCHATNGSEELPGVQCEACHGPGSDYKKMSIMKDLEAAKANGLVIPTQATCDGCHTGEDHAAKKVLADEKDNLKAIHKHKEK